MPVLQCPDTMMRPSTVRKDLEAKAMYRRGLGPKEIAWRTHEKLRTVYDRLARAKKHRHVMPSRKP